MDEIGFYIQTIQDVQNVAEAIELGLRVVVIQGVLDISEMSGHPHQLCSRHGFQLPDKPFNFRRQDSLPSRTRLHLQVQTGRADAAEVQLRQGLEGFSVVYREIQISSYRLLEGIQGYMPEDQDRALLCHLAQLDALLQGVDGKPIRRWQQGNHLLHPVAIGVRLDHRAEDGSLPQSLAQLPEVMIWNFPAQLDPYQIAHTF